MGRKGQWMKRGTVNGEEGTMDEEGNSEWGGRDNG